MRKFFLLGVLTTSIFFPSVFAQNISESEATSAIEKLEKGIIKYRTKRNFEADTNFINALNNQSYYYLFIDSDSTIKLAEKVKALSEKANYKRGVVNALLNLGRANYDDIEKAMDYYQQALNLAQSINYFKALADTYDEMGNTIIQTGEAEKSQEYLMKALPIYQSLGDKKGITYCLIHLSTVYRVFGIKNLRAQKNAEAEKDLVQMLDYGNRAIKSSESIGDKKLIIESLLNMSALYSSRNKWIEQIPYHQRAIKLYESIGDLEGVASVHNRNMDVYTFLGDYPKAIESAFNLLKIYEALHNTPAAAGIMTNIGILYGRQQMFDEAITYHKKSLSLKGPKAPLQDSAFTFINLGAVYRQKDDTSKALENYWQALRLFEKLGPNFIPGVATASNNISDIYIEGKRYDEALVFIQRALKIRKDMRASIPIADAYVQLAKVYTAKNQLDSAQKYAEEALDIGIKMNARSKLPVYYYVLASVYEAKGDGLNALYNERQGQLYQDSIRNDETEKKTAYLTADYEFSKKEITLKAQQAAQVSELKRIADIRELQQQNENLQLQKEKEQVELEGKLEAEALQRKNEQTELQRKIETQALQSKNEKEQTKSKIRLYSLLSSIVVFSLIALLLYRNIRNKQKANVVLTRQKKEIEIEKAKSDELLLNILPAEVAEELKEKGFTTAKSFDEITILFSDIVGFTHAAQRLTAEELVKEIDNYFSAFDKIMQEHGLEKIKTIGDAYIAAGGLPEQNIATAKTVVEAGIEMRNLVEEFKQERIKNNRPYFELRIGINTGPVVAGVVGIKKFQYDIWGDTVNMAARMEQSGVPGKINISQFTYERVKDDFNCTHRGKIEAKNKGEVDMYFVE